MVESDSTEQTYYTEIEIEEFDYDEDAQIFTSPCPCGDLFQISLEELEAGGDVATCDSCSLEVKVIYTKETLASYLEERKAKSSKASKKAIA